MIRLYIHQKPAAIRHIDEMKKLSLEWTVFGV
jgi:hypothetical protein